jgi:hypothetical protein
MNEQEHEKNLARLIRAAANSAARPAPELRRQTLLRLRSALPNGPLATKPLPERVPATVQQGNGSTISEPAFSRTRPQKSERNAEFRKETIMSKLFTGWGFGLTAAAGAATLILVAVLAAPEAKGRVPEVLLKAARALAKPTSVHLQGKLCTDPRDNFEAIAPNQEFVSIELWKQFSPNLKWRVEKPGRIAVMDGQSTILYIKPDYAVKVPHPTSNAFDTQWFQQMADLNQTIEQEIAAIKAHGWPVTVTSETGSDGKSKSVVSVESASGLPDGDYLKDAFLMTADTRRIYVFDAQSELLETVKIYLHGKANDQLVFELDRIEYNQPIDPSVFQLQLPADVAWEQEMQILPDNAKYAAMSAEQAARTFLEACSRQDWAEAGKFMSPIPASFKEDRGGLQLLNLGRSFAPVSSVITGARFVPYEIKYQSGTVIKHNLALKRDNRTGRWFVDGGI